MTTIALFAPAGGSIYKYPDPDVDPLLPEGSGPTGLWDHATGKVVYENPAAFRRWEAAQAANQSAAPAIVRPTATARSFLPTLPAVKIPTGPTVHGQALPYGTVSTGSANWMGRSSVRIGSFNESLRRLDSGLERIPFRIDHAGRAVGWSGRHFRLFNFANSICVEFVDQAFHRQLSELGIARGMLSLSPGVTGTNVTKGRDAEGYFHDIHAGVLTELSLVASSSFPSNFFRPFAG